MVYATGRLQPYSNREDFLTTQQMIDDQTGDLINLSGTLGSDVGAYTDTAWTVVAGAASTTSSTSITIPAYPISDELSALAITVGLGLDIEAGDPITIFPTSQAGNIINQMTGYVLSYNAATGALICQIGFTFQFEVKYCGEQESGSDYASYYDIGASGDAVTLLTASLGDGVTIVELGKVQIRIAEASFKKLSAKSYVVFLTATNSQDTRQMLIADLPVLYGGVAT